MKVLHGAFSFSCSLEQITKGTIKIFVTTCIRVMQIDIDFKHDVLMCFEGIAQTFENPKYVKPPIEGIVGVKIWHLHIYVTKHFVFLFFSSKGEWRNTRVHKPNK
jgi:hypothetical protein